MIRIPRYRSIIVGITLAVLSVSHPVSATPLSLPDIDAPDGRTTPNKPSLSVAVLPALVTAASSNSGGPIGSQFTVANISADVARPSIAYNTQDHEYLVVWQTQGSTNPGNIWATRIAADGRWIGNYQVEAGGSVTRSHPDVAYNSQDNDYYIVWQHDTGSRVTIRGKPLKRDGSVYGNTSMQLSSGVALKDCFEPAIAYAINPSPSDHRFIVV